ncbi:MAG: hypothetical protein JKY52_11310 [Flavobacteriales bacterium]|nr:hypothetical protein [Flavobacteriales bacterium]
MKKALLLFAMFAFIGTAYTATASVTNVAGIYSKDGPGDKHKHDKKCEKDCTKGASCAPGAKSSTAKKGGCCSRGAAAKSCGGKATSNASASNGKNTTSDTKTKEEKK